jgi:osmotically-inducible protein OsmY
MSTLSNPIPIYPLFRKLIWPTVETSAKEVPAAFDPTVSIEEHKAAIQNAVTRALAAKHSSKVKTSKQTYQNNQGKDINMKAKVNNALTEPALQIGKAGVFLAVLTAMQFLGIQPLTAAETGQVITDSGIATAVERDFQHEQGVSGAAIAVQSRQGIVSLSGTADNLLAKERAARIAASIRGVRGVVDRVVVTPVSRSDADIRKDILAGLLNDPATEAYQVAVGVKGGVATLTGSVGSWAEKQLAARVARGVKGLKEVRNEIAINYLAKRTDTEIAADVKSRLQWDIWLKGDSINTAVAQGKVTLAGTTASTIAKDRAFEDAWVNGVLSVDVSGLKVEPDSAERRATESALKPDGEIKSAIQAALPLDPRVAAFTRDITISVEGGVVILGGEVANLKAKSAAEQDARNTVGVAWVDNQLTVRPLMNLPRDSDTEKVLKAELAWDPLLDSSTIKAAVINHVAYISGAVQSGLEKAEAHDIAARTKGVLLVRDRLNVEPGLLTPYYDYYYGWPGYLTLAGGPNPLKSDAQIKKAIENALFWSPFVHRDDITVTVDGGVATLTGNVGSWIAWGEADKDAHQSGASFVMDRLSVR